MPNLTFVLPHWLYWLGLLAVPALAMWLLRSREGRPEPPQINLSIAYFLWFTGGFVGLHRYYLKSLLGFVYVPLFIAVLFANIEVRDARDGLSKADNEITSTEFLIERAQKNIERGRRGAEERLAQAREDHAQALAGQQQAAALLERSQAHVRWAALAIALLLLVDAMLLPRLLRQARSREAAEREAAGDQLSCEVCLEPHGGAARGDHLDAIQNPVTRGVDRLNGFAGNFVAYWSVIAVFVYYYEVIARYVFNSPTNWAHESMFLMFGMQYLLAGGYVLSQNGHVRVDVFYTHFSDRMKSAVDVATSLLFFIFSLTLMWTGWIFFIDSFSVREVSFTEWGIQYWPIKLAIPLGALLLLLQGAARLYKDIVFLARGGR